ncbi:MAG: PASTA domain-containing protein, partial [Rikenellaceae bacterium]|nr:PASTA domain-containing protein [Rikenellaceae bacterium]
VVVDDHKEGVIDLRRVFQVSSNIGFAKAVHQHYGGDKNSEGRFVDYISKMGLGQPLGIGLPGEASPLIKHPLAEGSAWDGTSLVMMSYGYALELTPMHTLALYNAVANNGRMVRPRLVREVSSYGQTVQKFGTEVINPAICSRPTLELVRSCLEGVVSEGTGGVLKNPYYDVAAKTGTAQMPFDNGGYTDSRGGRNYLATMVGYFPADNPKYTCIVAIKTYHGPGNRNTYYGASLPGPVFRAIADRVYASNTSWHTSVDTGREKQPPAPASVKNGTVEGLRMVASRLTLPFKPPRGGGKWIYMENPDGLRPATNDGDQAAAPFLTDDNQGDTVPSVKGMGLRDAMLLLEGKGMKVTFSGKGRVTSQSVAEGTQLRRGQAIHLNLTI